MNENRPKLKQKSRRGRPPKHGGYSLLTKGEMPENRRYLANYLSEVREGLIEDIGPAENDLSTAQKVLIDRVISKLGVVRCVEEFIRENSVIVGNDLAPSLKASYLAYNNSIRLDLQALGIEKRVAEKVLAPYEIVEKAGKK
jgi:hypothetical protein